MTVAGRVYQDTMIGLGVIPGPKFEYNGLNKPAALASAQTYAVLTPPQGCTPAIAHFLIWAMDGTATYGGSFPNAHVYFCGKPILPVTKTHFEMKFNGIMI